MKEMSINGWTEELDQDTMKFFYLNTESGETRWRKPMTNLNTPLGVPDKLANSSFLGSSAVLDFLIEQLSYNPCPHLIHYLRQHNPTEILMECESQNEVSLFTTQSNHIAKLLYLNALFLDSNNTSYNRSLLENIICVLNIDVRRKVLAHLLILKPDVNLGVESLNTKHTSVIDLVFDILCEPRSKVEDPELWIQCYHLTYQQKYFRYIGEGTGMQRMTWQPDCIASCAWIECKGTETLYHHKRTGAIYSSLKDIYDSFEDTEIVLDDEDVSPDNIPDINGSRPPLPPMQLDCIDVANFRCALSGRLMKDPVIVEETSARFEREVISKAIQQGNGVAICPITSQEIHMNDLMDDMDTRNKLYQWHLSETVRLDKQSNGIIKELLDYDLYDFES